MGIYVASKVREAVADRGEIVASVAELTAAQYNAALEDQSGVAFSANFTSAKADIAIANANLSGLTTSIADSLAIPVTHRAVEKTTGADAEALTLANGVPGQRLLITLIVDGGGDGTLTPATSLNFATIVFADAGDGAFLEYVDDTVGWVIVGLYGLAAQPAYTLPA